MSQINATITDIESEGILHIVSFNASGYSLKMMSLELDRELKVGTKVLLSVKATAVAIAKDISGVLSYSNQLAMEIESIESGTLLSSLRLSNGSFTLDSIITKASQERMSLTPQESVTALIKSSDLSIMKSL